MDIEIHRLANLGEVEVLGGRPDDRPAGGLLECGSGRSEAGPSEQEDLPNAQPGDDGQVPPMRIVGCLEAEPLARCEFAHRRLVRISVAARAGSLKAQKRGSTSQVTRRADSMPSATIGALVGGGAPSVDAITVMSASMPPRRP